MADCNWLAGGRWFEDLCVSVLDTAKEHIEGKSSIDEAQKRIQSYYEQRTDRTEVENDTKEADIVSARIAKLLGEKALVFLQW